MDDHRVTTPRNRQAVIACRPQTSDLAVAGSSFGNVAGSALVDEYRLADLRVTGRFVDIGAHIGSVTIAVLLDNPDATAVAVEPIPENLEVLRANVAANGLEGRCEVIEGAVGTASIHYDWGGDETATTNRYIGNLSTPLRGRTIKVRKVALRELLPAAALKMDCEGGEWAILRDPRIVEVPLIFGEYHGLPGANGVLEALNATHRIEFANVAASTGNFWAVAR